MYAPTPIATVFLTSILSPRPCTPLGVTLRGWPVARIASRHTTVQASGVPAEPRNIENIRAEDDLGIYISVALHGRELLLLRHIATVDIHILSGRKGYDGVVSNIATSTAAILTTGDTRLPLS